MYQALYNKYRPMTFEDVAGQSHITDVLQNQLALGRRSHAYLFCGSRGTGKTTCARILAKGINCAAPVNGNPCGVCEFCTGITDGTLLDVVEIDAASNTGVDSIRELRSESEYTPVRAKCKIFIIDEVHMLSDAAFNALLKTLEEPPAYVVFIFATTEAHKIPATILSRCMRFDFKRIAQPLIADRLEAVCNKEGIGYDREGLEFCARVSDGAMRNALSLLEQCSNAAEKITAASVAESVGLSDAGDLLTFASLIAKDDAAACAGLLDRLYADGLDLACFIDQMTSLMRDIMLFKQAGNAFTLAGTGYMYDDLARLASLISHGRLMYSVDALQAAYARLARCSNRYTEVEMCLMRLCEPALGGETTAFGARLGELERKLRAISVSGATPVTEPDAAATPQKKEQKTAGGHPVEQDHAPSKPIDYRDSLLERLSEHTMPMLMPFLEKADFYQKGSVLFVECQTEMAKTQLEAQKITGQIEQDAAGITGNSVTVRLCISKKIKEEKKDKLDELADIINGIEE